MKHMAKINEAVGMKNYFTMGGGRETVSSSFQQARVLEMHCLFSISSYLWEERTQDL